jgi:hypothetical protein
MSATKEWYEDVLFEEREKEHTKSDHEKQVQAAEEEVAIECLYCHRPLPKDKKCTNCNI